LPIFSAIGLMQGMIDYFKHRKLKFDILTIFLSLFILSLTFVIIFTYRKNSQSILKFSKGEMERTSSGVIEKLNDLVQNIAPIPEITEGFLRNLEHPSMNNPELRTYMLDVVKNYPLVYAFYIGKADGSYIEVYNLQLDKQTHLLTEPAKPLPQDALYSFRFIDRAAAHPVETWEYKNRSFETVASETIDPAAYDPRSRPWYSGAEVSRQPYWTDVYPFSGSAQLPGITIANPVYNSAGELIYVVGLDVTMASLDSFLAAQRVGKTGRAMILNRAGALIIPSALQGGAINDEVVARAFNFFSKEGQTNFTFESGKVKYLAYITPFPVHIGKEWLVTIIVPLNDFFAELIQTQLKITFISIAILFFGTLIVIYFSSKISKPIVTLAGEVDRLRQLDLSSSLRVSSNIKEIQIMDRSVAAMRGALSSFGRYVPKEIVRQLMVKGQEITLGGEKKEMTVFFSDIAGFTSIAETVPTDLLISLLADYFGPLSEIILSQGGTIDKYIGDSIMAFWNAPSDCPDHVFKACQTALLCQEFLQKLNAKLKSQNRPELPTRMGIHTGKAFVGNIGTAERMNYTAIGDVVNIAERLEQIAKEYHAAIVISEEVYQKVRTHFQCKPLDSVAVKGRKEKINIYELMFKT
jgi:adenylate cyclase